MVHKRGRVIGWCHVRTQAETTSTTSYPSRILLEASKPNVCLCFHSPTLDSISQYIVRFGMCVQRPRCKNCISLGQNYMVCYFTSDNIAVNYNLIATAVLLHEKCTVATATATSCDLCIRKGWYCSLGRDPTKIADQFRNNNATLPPIVRRTGGVTGANATTNTNWQQVGVSNAVQPLHNTPARPAGTSNSPANYASTSNSPAKYRAPSTPKSPAKSASPPNTAPEKSPSPWVSLWKYSCCSAANALLLIYAQRIEDIVHPEYL